MFPSHLYLHVIVRCGHDMLDSRQDLKKMSGSQKIFQIISAKSLFLIV